MIIHTIDFQVDWDKFVVGSSFFIPCLNWKKAKLIVQAECRSRGISTLARMSIEEGIRGLRVWRLDELAAAKQFC
jgi:hypothetical protein